MGQVFHSEAELLAATGMAGKYYLIGQKTHSMFTKFLGRQRVHTL